jgi:carbohydrate-selective porin OprB
VSRTEDFVFVALERSNSGVDVSGVLLGIMWYATLCGEEHAGELRAQVLLSIVHIAEIWDSVSVVGGGEKGRQFGGRKGAGGGVTLWPFLLVVRPRYGFVL